MTLNATPERRDIHRQGAGEKRHAGIDNGDGNVRSGLRLNVPRLFKIDERQVPLQVGVPWIVRLHRGVHVIGGLRVDDFGPRIQRRRHRFGVFGRVDIDDVEVGVGGSDPDVSGP
ncbi:MAG: hypothetical protein JF601_06285 [Acidobacteria bacterium]|nr:hypothetical protein [Acidobacteriota bacterium]